MSEVVELILHADDALTAVFEENVTKAYLLIFLIILCESALIICFFLPGDGLLFSAGVVVAAAGQSILLLVVILIVAAIAGNLFNYMVGKSFGDRLEHSHKNFVQHHLIKYIRRTEKFYARHGKNAVILGRFFPVIRSFVPFLAGVGEMQYRQFVLNTVTGAIVWVCLFCFGGYFLGEIPWVQDNYMVIFLGIIIVCLSPVIFAGIKKLFSIFSVR